MSATMTRESRVGAVTKRVRWDEMHNLPDNPINMARIERIETEGGFDPSAVGTPELALNDALAFPDLPDDALIIIDGHHRRKLWQRAKVKGSDDVICKIHRGLEREEIERLFLQANDYRVHHVNELFVHRVHANERKAVAMNEIVINAGFVIPAHQGPGKRHIRGANAVEWVYNGGRSRKRSAPYHPKALIQTLQSLSIMYGDDKDVTRSNLIKGLGLFYLRYGDKIDIERLHRQVPRKYTTAHQLLRDSKVLQDAMKMNVPESIAYTLRVAYNGVRRGRHDLPEFR